MGTIDILRGRTGQLLGHASGLAAGDPAALWLYCPPDRFRTWNGLRVLLHQLRRRLGPEAVDRTVARHRAAVSFASPELVPTLTADERAERRGLACRVESHLSHNWYLQRALFDAWAEFLVDLLPEGRCRLLIPVLNHLDQPSLFVLKSLYRRFPEAAPDLVAGYDAEAQSPSLDADGLYWSYEPLNIQKIAYGFQLSAGSELIDLTSKPALPSATPESVLPADALRSLGHDLESRARTRLEATDGELDAADVELVVSAVVSTFESFGYRAALGLGLDLLAQEPGLSAEQAATVHGIVGLAAHNRQFHSRRNEALKDFLEKHFRAAFEHETDPVRRCALRYRLAVTLGRRRQQFEPAVEFASSTIAAAAELSPLERTYQEAWARNIRAYLLMRLRRIDEAVVDAEASFDLIERYSPENRRPETPEERLWSRDFLLSKGVLISNLASLAAVSGSADQHEKWNRLGAGLALDDPSFDRFRVLDWISLYRRNHQPKLALPWARRGAEVCRREQETLWEYHFLLQESDLLYRLGDAEGAFQRCQEMEDLRTRLGRPIGIKDTALLSVNAAVRSGRHDVARTILERRLDDVHYDDHKSQIASHLGWLAALAGDGRQADGHLNQAIEWAVSSGQRDSLLRVAAAAGRSSRILGRHDEADAAFRRALAIAEADDKPPPASDLLEVLLGLQPEGDVDTDLARRALVLLPQALKTDEAWWSIGRLLDVLIRWASADASALGACGLAEPLAQLVTAAGQRIDTSTQRAALLDELPKPVVAELPDRAMEEVELA